MAVRPPKQRSIRLHVPDALAQAQGLLLSEPQSHYLAHVMRCVEGDQISLFNGRDGEWQATLAPHSKKCWQATPSEQTKPQTKEPPVSLWFAPVKSASVERLVQMAAELGVAEVQPVRTERTIVSRINEERLTANLVEAAEQCERLSVPALRPYLSLPEALVTLPSDTYLIFADESGAGQPMPQRLQSLPMEAHYAVLIGPEGGFTPAERARIGRVERAIPVGLGPRILRADTAASATLACLMSWLGAWDAPPHYKEPV